MPRSGTFPALEEELPLEPPLEELALLDAPLVVPFAPLEALPPDELPLPDPPEPPPDPLLDPLVVPLAPTPRR